MVVIIKDLHSKCQCATASGFSYAGQVTDTHTSNEGDTRRKRERETEGEVETTPHRLVPPTPGTQTFVIGRRLLLWSPSSHVHSMWTKWETECKQTHGAGDTDAHQHILLGCRDISSLESYFASALTILGWFDLTAVLFFKGLHSLILKSQKRMTFILF